MTPEEIKRYLALPEEFQVPTLYREYDMWWERGHQIINDDEFGDCPVSDGFAELLAIASMLVGLAKEMGSIWIVNVKTNYGRVWEVRTETDNCGDVHLGHGPSDFLALLAACEAVVKNRGEA